MTPFLICLIFYIAILAFSLWRPNATRIFLGLFYLLMAWGVNATFVATNPNAFAALGASSFIPFYRTIFTEIIGAHPLFWGMVAVAWETTAGLLILSRGKAVKAGLIMFIIFLIGITPFVPETQINGIFIVALHHLAMKEYPHSLLDLIRNRHRAPRRAAA
ncbi:MAG TPA: hypothetical protein VD969_07930 [Symbiobacteriaceae bacterium]|nr:hypothetical protein [Symbiobacteriaceae bacterium]